MENNQTRINDVINNIITHSPQYLTTNATLTCVGYYVNYEDNSAYFLFHNPEIVTNHIGNTQKEKVGQYSVNCVVYNVEGGTELWYNFKNENEE